MAKKTKDGRNQTKDERESDGSLSHGISCYLKQNSFLTDRIKSILMKKKISLKIHPNKSSSLLLSCLAKMSKACFPQIVHWATSGS